VWSSVYALISNLILTCTGAAVENPELEVVRVTLMHVSDLRSVVAATYTVSDSKTWNVTFPIICLKMQVCF
jgi:hypothetical protein